jgi:hypothetical protein
VCTLPLSPSFAFLPLKRARVWLTASAELDLSFAVSVHGAETALLRVDVNEQMDACLAGCVRIFEEEVSQHAVDYWSIAIQR